ncbi:thioesterase family protein [Treponema primitia ZAS-2]|uniref:Thioesterase family protein n=1 Tax=Treponema primitia (strain ATCC BAA-887 / DSM 12427 / ZAS-2) TaxID=545694 RepID=F5YR67_TREPZ|nr:thioesterase family protein [Treponema primitia]AEF83665.1 thioesterase family protein [Treponema primitia ZAS-2]
MIFLHIIWLKGTGLGLKAVLWYSSAMELNTFLSAGLRAEKTEQVTDRNTAKSWGSGELPVYATPAMIALMEGAAVAAVQDKLPPGISTVGTELQIKHLAASPLGIEVRAWAELIEVDGRRLRFKVEAADAAGKIGEGVHERFVIENERFLKKTSEKKQ